MDTGKELVRIRNGVWLLCVLSVIGFLVSVALSIHLSNRNIAVARELSGDKSTEQTLINELGLLLESNQLDALITRCEKEIRDKPLSRTGHFYLGLAHFHRGDHAQSRKHLEEAARIDPAWAPATEPYLKILRGDSVETR